MHKVLNDSAKALFADVFQRDFSRFKLKKSLRGPLPSAANFEHRLSDQRSAWICFGGFKDSSFAVLAAWTVSGVELKALEEWEQYGNPRAFEIPPRPTDGYADLRDRWRFAVSPGGATWHSLELPDPPEGFALHVLEGYVSSDAFRQAVEAQHAGAMRLYTRNPPSFEQSRNDCYDAERTLCLSLWGHLAKRHSFSDGELGEFLLPVVRDAVDLVRVHGIPLLEERIAHNAV